MDKRNLNNWFIIAVMVLGMVFVSDAVIFPVGYISVVYLLFGILLFVIGGLLHLFLNRKV
jgi:hypothetical protein